ncbi:helix-turn-helix transcriptional regulator [Nocardioides cynanchi]|uniref:helix-turn-helix transcriptional regulator n=1 Tax=Nocardioides cynanchi TaxID=2558918 RepID=UPI001246F2F6|nr:LuxR family transcriptional regulator [Nocardioides cynanchi]
MLEPWGADSSTSYEPVADDSARVLILARDALSQGRIGDASAAVDSVGRDDVPAEVRAGLALIGLVARLARGDVRGAAPYSRELTGLTRERGRVAALAWYGLAELAAARAQTDLAITAFEHVDEEQSTGRDHPWLPWRSGVARLIAGRGEIATANALVEKELAEARSSDSPYAVAYALRTLAAVAPTSDRIGLLEDALDTLAGVGAARLEAQIRTDLAGWLMLLQPAEKARSVELLRSAEAYSRREDLGPLLSRVRWLLERLGEHADGELPGRLAELSAAERRVAQRVVTGKRNREIAEELGVSVKSVEWHVSHILRKLSITSRGELADALAQPRQQR